MMVKFSQKELIEIFNDYLKTAIIRPTCTWLHPIKVEEVVLDEHEGSLRIYLKEE